MNSSRIIRSLAAIALAIAIVPAVSAQEKKETKQTRETRRVVIVKDGQVFTSDGTSRMPRLAARGFLGVQMVDLTPELREHFRVSKTAGVLVSKVVPDSPAARAGIRVGDIITAVDGQPVRWAGDLTRAVRDKKKGESVRIDYSRDGANATAIAAVAERERKEIDLRELNIDIPDIHVPAVEIPEIHVDIPDMQIPDAGKHLGEYFNSPEWKAKMAQIQNLDCGQMQDRMRQLETKMKDLEKRLGQK